MHDLEPLEPSRGVEMYLEDREQDGAADWTIYGHRSRLGQFLRWCDEDGIENLNDLGARDLRRYKIWRGEDVSKVTLASQLDTLRVFIRWCEGMDAVRPDLSESVQSPTIAKGEDAREVMLSYEDATERLEYLRKYEYATPPHVILELMVHTAMRRGGLHALDLEDYDSDDRTLAVRHRPESNTPIKNGRDGERLVAVDESVATVIDDYLNETRHDVTDDSDREPLITTMHGRPHLTTLANWIYGITRPCKTNGGECPHDWDPDECEAAQRRNDASKCPSSVSPHAVRRGALTHWLSEGMPRHIAGDRANVSEDVLEEHYDERSERGKMEQRREYLDDL